MSWNKKTIIIGFGILCSVFVSVLSSCASYAIDDLTYTLDSSHSSQQFCYQSACDGFKYALITSSEYFPGSSSTDVVFSLQAPLSSPQTYSSRRVSSIFLSPFQSVILPLNFDSFNRITVSLDNSSSWGSVSVTITLSDSIPSSCPSSPSGNIDISENGQYDVTNYATATVNVPAEVIPGDYHDDLVSINNSILVCAAVCLVIYFFYCIYRMIIKGVK